MKDEKFPWSTILIIGLMVGYTVGAAKSANTPSSSGSEILKLMLTIAHYARYTIFVFVALIIISAFSLIKAEPEDLGEKKQCRAGMLIGIFGCICSGVLCMIVP